MAIHWLDWASPSNVRAAYSCRHGGFSLGDYAGLNLGDHVQDDPQVVERNRQQVIEMLQCPSAPIWLTQTHSTRVFIADGSAPIGDYDASYTNQVAQTLVVMTADCLPVIFCDRAGTVVAAAHAGWRGLVSGVLEEAVRYI